MDAALGNLGIISRWYIHEQVIISLFITLHMLAYINHTEVDTTFMVKLVAVFLCLTLTLLGSLGFLLYGLDAADIAQKQSLQILTFLIPLATLIILLGAPQFFNSSLLHPLRMVVRGVQAVDQGDLSIQIPVVVHDEIGTLAESFNRMTTSLQAYSQEMRSLVSQRTGELERESFLLCYGFQRILPENPL
jgi:HAMP domain-containing protein